MCCLLGPGSLLEEEMTSVSLNCLTSTHSYQPISLPLWLTRLRVLWTDRLGQMRQLCENFMSLTVGWSSAGRRLSLPVLAGLGCIPGRAGQPAAH